MTKLTIRGIFLFFSYLLLGQNHGEFKNRSFPSYLIDNSIIESRNLGAKFNMLVNECNWSSRIGQKVDVFWMNTEKGSYFGHVYEYFMDCDNLRLIYWYDTPTERGEIVEFMIEDLEDDSKFVTSKKNYLRNRKKYSKYLEKK